MLFLSPNQQRQSTEGQLLTYLIFTRTSTRERSVVMTVSVSVCPRVYLPNYTSDLYEIFVHVTYDLA